MLYEGSPSAGVLACAIPGRKHDMPESLVQRFFLDIQGRTNKALDPAESVCRLLDIKWPDPGRQDAAERQQLLLLNIKHSAELASAVTPTDPKGFARQLSASLEKVLMLRHKVNIRGWKQNGEAELLRWYLNYWDEAAADIDRVRVVLFFNLILPDVEPKRWSLFGRSKPSDQVPEEAGQIFTIEHQAFRSRMLTPLKCITMKHLEEWMEDHKLALEHERTEKCRELMIDTDSCLPMENLQGKLKRFCDDLNRVKQRV